MPDGQAEWQQIWAYVFLLFESATILSTCSVYAFMMRTRNRSADVDARSGSRLLSASVDVFVATYNEDRDILERTLVGATSIEHPDLRVWVLDDGARPWVAELAAELGCFYTSRVKGKHAKAGNVNNGLAVATSTGRKPDFMLLLDADFVAARHILRRTLPLFEEADVGIVQTPQHFFNPDPIQSNLLCATSWPDEQRFFYSHFLASKDAWGAAFCCGTSAVFRVAALQACGGMATATVTEDMLTAFVSRKKDTARCSSTSSCRLAWRLKDCWKTPANGPAGAWARYSNAIRAGDLPDAGGFGSSAVFLPSTACCSGRPGSHSS